MSSVSSSSGILGPNLVYNYRNQIESGSSSQALSSISFPSFPERPDQPECRYFMNTGSCKYGADCKYHHPKERLAQIASNMGPFGLPLRPVSSGLKTFRSNNFYGLQFWACLGTELLNSLIEHAFISVHCNRCLLNWLIFFKFEQLWYSFYGTCFFGLVGCQQVCMLHQFGCRGAKYNQNI